MNRLWQGIIFYLALPGLYLVALLPFWLLYRVADLSFYAVYYVAKYRRKIVADNLRQAFPKATQGALKRLERDFYRHFCDLLVEYIKSLTISPKQIAKRCVLQNPALLEQYYTAGLPILLASGHQGNWEWAAHAIALQTKYTLAVAYKPLSNPYFDALVARLRTRFGRQIIPAKKILRTLLTQGIKPQATAILADQSPSTSKAYLTEFLNRPTYVDPGIGKLAHRLNQPLVYIHIKKVTRGYYRLQSTLLFKSPGTATPTHLTQLYTQCLQKAIYQQPSTWLWSHNRWKQ